MKKMITVKAPAKVNLYLKILSQREDGYHNISSLMQMVGLYDLLTFREEGSKIRLSVGDQILPTDCSNLVIQAAELLQKEMRAYGISKGASITLKKNVPIAAGLGGGSSDAAATLVGLNRLWSLGWSRERLARIGERLGSDVPFFFYGPTAWISGKGERVERSAAVYPGWIVLVNPGKSISTAWAYRQFSKKLGLTKKGPDITIDKFIARRPSLEEIFRHPYNDLEKVTLEAFPHLIQIKRELYRLGGEGVLMSGSGPTLFALFAKHDIAKRAALAIERVCSVQACVARVLRRSPF